MGAATRWWRWLRGRAPLEALSPRPPAAAAAWSAAVLATVLVEWASPLPAVVPALLSLAGEALLVSLVPLAVRRRWLWPQVLQAAGLLAALRTLVLAPVLLMLAASAAGMAPGRLLLLFVPVALATVAAMAWLVGRYLALWREVLRTGARTAALVMLALAAALLLIEAVLG